jgi:hypothetical protein
LTDLKDAVVLRFLAVEPLAGLDRHRQVWSRVVAAHRAGQLRGHSPGVDLI